MPSMPAPLAVDKEQVRMLVMSVGVREAARRCKISESTVQAWSAKGRWIADMRHPSHDATSPPLKVQPETPLQPLPLSIRPTTQSSGATIVTSPADVLADVLADDKRATVLAMSRASRRGIEHLAQLADPDELATRHQELHGLAKVADITHQLSGSASGAQVNVNLLIQP